MFYGKVTRTTIPKILSVSPLTPKEHPYKVNKKSARQFFHNSTIRSDEGLTLETSAFEIFHGGNSTFINSFDKTKFLSSP